MAPVTSFDIVAIIMADAIPIDLPLPLKEYPEGFRWLVRQPEDWIYDMALAVQDAAEEEILAQPELEASKRLPPSKSWVEKQQRAKREAEKRIAELEEREKAKTITPEEDIELINTREYLNALIDPKDYNRATEIARTTSTRARDMWLLPRTIVGEDGSLIFDLTTKEGAERWHRLGRKTKDQLRIFLWRALVLVQYAKNSNADQSSA